MIEIVGLWGLIALVSVIWVVYDIFTKNKNLPDMHKAIWIIAALLFGILGAIAYYFLGRKK